MAETEIPEGIPPDVWEAAKVGAALYEKRQILISRAILAERERCAKIAEDAALGGTKPWREGFRKACESIASSIRSGAQHE